MENRHDSTSWERRKQQIKARHPELKDEDLDFSFEKEEEMLEHLQHKLRKTKEEIRSWLHLMG